jgi:hypothetical protein
LNSDCGAVNACIVMRMNISPLVVYLVLLAIAVLFGLLVLEAAVFWLG